MRGRTALLQSLTFVTLLTGGANVANPANSGSPQRGCDYAMIVFDGSGSMDASSEPKLAYAQEAVHAVVPDIARDRDLGLILYGDPDGGTKVGGEQCFSRIALSVAPQANAAFAILRAVDAISPQGMTPLTRAVEWAVTAAKDGTPPGAIVLVTDGLENCGGRPCELGRYLHATRPGLAVHVIGLDFAAKADAALSCLASATGGTIREAKNAAGLTSALRDTLACPAVSDAAPQAPTRNRRQLS